MKKKLLTFVILSLLSATHAKNPFDFSKENLQKVVGNIKGKRTLDLSHKKIKKLPSDLSAQLKPVVDDSSDPVELINFAHNDISKKLKKGTFKGLTKPTSIVLSNNNITTVEPGAFAALNSLQVIDLSYNKIKKLPLEAFDTIMGLSHLVLSHNQLSIIEVGVFDNLRLLYSLDLSHNKIKKLESAMFATIDATSKGFTAKGPRRASNLNTIDLRCNPIKTVAFDVFAGLQELKNVKISSNLSSSVQKKIQESIDHVNQAFNRTGNSKCKLHVVPGACK